MSSYNVLLYHGVHDDDCDLGLFNRSGKHISIARFRAQMKDLAENHQVVSLSDIISAHYGEADIPDDAVAITFDDGFLNNYSTAWPVLEEFQIPAVIYLATGFIGTGRSVWSDRLEKSILGSTSAHCLPQEFGLNSVYNIDSEQSRVDAFLDIKSFCKNLANVQKDDLVTRIEAHLGAPDFSGHPLFEFMNWDQVREMNESRLISFGAHTVDHVSLGKVPSDEMRFQIKQSVAKVSKELGDVVRFFSYPEGMEQDFNQNVINFLREQGFNHCPTAMFGSNDTDITDPFRIKRNMVGFEGRPYPYSDI